MAKPWLGKVEALFHFMYTFEAGYEKKRVYRNFDTPSTTSQKEENPYYITL